MLVYNIAHAIYKVSAFIMRCNNVLKWFSHYYLICSKTSLDQGGSDFPMSINPIYFSCFTTQTINLHFLAPSSMYFILQNFQKDNANKHFFKRLRILQVLNKQKHSEWISEGLHEPVKLSQTSLGSSDGHHKWWRVYLILLAWLTAGK